ncbi:DUF4145 domain-containing protein [Ruminococcus sp. AF14-10]|nr:DUF4145 domain-containing protein [Ruminococcus sp. AF14-10]
MVTRIEKCLNQRRKKLVQIFHIMNYLESKKSYDMESMHRIREVCNKNVHVMGNGEALTEESTRQLIWDMMLVSVGRATYDQKEVCDELAEKMNMYSERAQKYALAEKYEDAFLNLRKALECVVHGYIKTHHMICTYGHENSISGYIDLLYEKKYISRQSKENMHRIRGAGNKAVHMKEIKSIKAQLPELLMAMEKEIQLYEQHRMKEENTNEYMVIDDDAKMEKEEQAKRRRKKREREEQERKHEEEWKQEESRDAYAEKYCRSDNYDVEDTSQRYEEECMLSEMNNPEKYWDPTRKYDPEIQCDPNEYYDTGINL